MLQNGNRGRSSSRGQNYSHFAVVMPWHLSAVQITEAVWGWMYIKRPIHRQLNWAISLRDVIPDEKLSKLSSFDSQWCQHQNCPFHSSFTHRTAQFTQGIPQFPQFTCRHHDGIISRHSVTNNSLSILTLHDIVLSRYPLLRHIFRYLFFFSGNNTAAVASKQQTTALFSSTTVTRTRRHAELTKKWHTWWETCAVPENIQFSISCSFYTVKQHSLTYSVWGLYTKATAWSYQN
jgi:hypothetical protein